MCLRVIEVSAVVVTAIGSLLVAIFAIWGDYWRYLLAGPQLSLSLNDPSGDLTARSNGMQAYFFHLKIKNRRLWSPARDVRVLIDRIARRRPDGSFLVDHLVYPLPLIWTPSEMGDFQRSVGGEETCDLGFLDQNSTRFQLHVLMMPNNVHAYVEADDAIRLSVVATGQNVTSSRPLFLEVAWDGDWTANKAQMRTHLVVKEIAKM